MASAFHNAWQTALEAEGKLLKSLAEKEPTFTEISHYLSEFRAACQTAILQDFETSRSIDVETRLWDAHVKINTRFRKLLARFREENAKKKKPVERRKLEKHYLDFIKSSQRFYRGYIQQLSSHFGGIPELEKVARKFNFDNLSAQPSGEASDTLRADVLRSCHSTLIRLGDLSRYRETELVSKDRNWGPAIGYYDLAIAIYPASGASHNQLAVIALADGNHLRATYHLYRALAAQEPHPSAKGNLEIEFRKVRHAWRKRELIRPEDAGIPGRALAPWFVYLHAQCYKGNDFPEHDELESEVLNQLAVDLKERSLEGTLQKFCLINIAAEDFSRTQPDESASNSRLFFQRINVKTFFTLLQILLAELERFAVEDSLDKDVKSGPDKVTVVARRVLPALRHYSSWLLIVSHSLVAHKEEKDTPLAVQITEFWKIYANTLSLLASTFDVVHLPEIDYLLEEDEESLGFAPLNKDATSRRYLSATGQQKPRMTDVGVERSHPNIEMLYRIREFVIDGLDLVVSNRIPIALVDDEDKKTFIYKEDGLPSQFFASPSGHHNTLSTASVEREDVQQVTKDVNYVADSRSIFGGSQSASASMSANMHRIVEGVERLVESDTYENAPTLPDQLPFPRSTNQQPIPSNFFESNLSSTLRETDAAVRHPPIAPPGLGLSMPNSAALSAAPLSQSYTPRPSLPGIPSIWSTGLSPDIGENSAPRTPPGLGQHPGQAVTANISSPGPHHASHDMTANELIFRNSLVGQALLQNPLGGSSSMSSWASASNPAAHHRLSGTGWDRSPLGRAASPPSLGVPSQPMSSGLANASWANDAFLASTLSSGAGFPSSGPTSRRSASHFGAIGQTPSYGQGG